MIDNNKELSEQIARHYKERITKSWKTHARLRKLFSRFGNMTAILNGENFQAKTPSFACKEIPRIYLVKNLKDVLQVAVSRAGKFAREEESAFLAQIDESSIKKVTAIDVADVLESCMEAIENNGYTPSLILFGASNARIKNSICHADSFDPPTEASRIEWDGSMLLGFYGNIPAVGIQNEYFTNKVLICDFSAAFHLHLRQKDVSSDLDLSIDVRNLKNKRVQSFFASEQQDCLDAKAECVEKDALARISNGVIVQFASEFHLEILEHAAATIGLIDD